MPIKPSIVLSNPQEQCISFFWDEMPGQYVGYRFLEGQPTVTEQPILGYETQPIADYPDPPSVVEGSDQPAQIGRKNG